MFDKEYDVVEGIWEEEGIVLKRGEIWGQYYAYEQDYWIELPDGTTFEYTENYFRHWSNMPAFARLWRQTGGFCIDPGSTRIPVDVAIKGKAAIAVYLVVVGQNSREEVAEKMEVQEDTIRKYITDYSKGRR